MGLHTMDDSGEMEPPSPDRKVMEGGVSWWQSLLPQLGGVGDTTDGSMSYLVATTTMVLEGGFECLSVVGCRSGV